MSRRNLLTLSARVKRVVSSTSISFRNYQSISFASPESDFSAARIGEVINYYVHPSKRVYLSFASPESDFAMGSTLHPSNISSNRNYIEALESIQRTYSLSSPEADFTSMHAPSFYSNDMYAPAQLSFSSPESDFVGSVSRAVTLSEMKLSTNLKNEQKTFTIQDALMPSIQPRVITEAIPPFKVVHANEAWEKEQGRSPSGALEHTLAMANLKALGKNQATAALTSTSQVKVVPLDKNYLFGVVEEVKVLNK